MRPTAPAVRLLPLLLAALAACGGPQSAPRLEGAEGTPPAEPAPERRAPTMRTATELGEIDKKETIQTFERLKTSFFQCQKKGLERVEYLEGEAKFFVRIGQDGNVRWTTLPTISSLFAEMAATRA